MLAADRRLPAWAGDALGAFADGALLFPLIAVLSQRGLWGAGLVMSAGLLYLVAAAVFRVPMAVQPLKAVVVGAAALKATPSEIAGAGFIVAIVCMALASSRFDRYLALVPRALVHGLQLGVGCLLICQGIFVARELMPVGVLAAVACGVALVALTYRTGLPWLGLAATAGLIGAVWSGTDGATVAETVGGWGESIAAWHGKFRWTVCLSLAAPQVALTLANSVVGTAEAAARYFGRASVHVTERRLLWSIGLGNVLTNSLGALPFCHGAGGVTAHAQGGATTWRAPVIVGTFLVALGALGAVGGTGVLHYPPVLLAPLLVAIGVFHSALALPTWRLPQERFRLVGMGVVVLATGSLLWSLALGGLFEVPRLIAARRRAL